jgi:hypothetical protein
MAWKSLTDRDTGIDKRPHVLAGPILRKVTSKTVTVWFALRKAGKVTVTVLDAGNDNPMKEGDGHTVAIGTKLHIVAVTAKTLPQATDLVEGKIYRYDVAFEYDDNQSESLASATGHAKLTYTGFDKPSFCLPPKDITKLRMIHGSCRIPHGNGTDTLPMLDGLIERDAKDPYKRPHQLLMTGDQIYADDVGYAMSMMLMDASEAMLGWTEEVVCNVPASNTKRPVTDMYPGLRGHITQIDAGFTSVDFHGQLIGLGEYLAMYLFVWSDVLWPASFTLPTFDEIKSFFSSREKATDREVLDNQRMLDAATWNTYRWVEFDRDDVTDETERTASFGRTVKDVRRALANIPTYTIFDDHDVTDDWNMTRQFCEDVYGSPLGLRIVQNGLTAYALCQHWGNVPEQFRTPTGVPPGGKLLLLLDQMSSATAYDNASAQARALVGIHDAATLKSRPNKGLFHDANSLTYNYTIEGDGHQVIVTDTRTWRDYPRKAALDGGDLLPLSQLQAQIANATPPTGDRQLLVVLTTNAPPAQPIRTATRRPNLTKKLTNDPSSDLYEAWEMPRNSTDLLFRVISDRLPLANGTRRGSVLLLSGDVHTSFCSRMLFRGTTRYRDPQDKPQPVNAVFVQMVSSSLRKQTDMTEGQHIDGFTYAPTGAGWLVAKNKPESYFGWNLPDGQTKRVGVRVGIGFKPIKIKGPRTYSVWDMEIGFKEEVAHDWSYRLDYLTAQLEGMMPSSPPPSPAVPTGHTAADRERAAKVTYSVILKYQEWIKANASPRQMVGVNNIGEITFGAKNAMHTLYWHDWATGTDRSTKYVCSLDPDDSAFPELKPLP